MASNKLLVFADPGYPGTSSPSLLTRLIPGEYELVTAAELGEALQSASCSLLISFHGAYFPKEAWPQLVCYLENGGNLAVFGGMPFTRPVHPDGSIEIEQQAYCNELFLGPHFPLQVPEGSGLQLAAAEEAAFLAHHALTLSPSQADHFWSFYPKLTQLSYDAQEMGAVGPFDTLLTPLLYLDEQDTIDTTHLATLATLLDQQSGRFAGGRWLLSPWLPETTEDWLEIAPVLHDLLHLTGKGATVLQVRPLLASYQAGETPTLAISSRSRSAHRAQIVVRSPQQESIASFDVGLQGSSSLQEVRFQLSSLSTPGLYTIETLFQDERDVIMRSQSGFWIWDEELVTSCASLRLERGRDFFFCNGEPFPLFGTTYMDSKVQRKFLALPNPARWDADFATLQKAGVNVIRTGIWTGWRELMPQVGDTNEQMLRALDAFVLTACRYRIQIIFTFFSFFPPLFEGINPWLDPRSLSGQKDLVTILARRYAAISLLSWDLINEPSFGNPKRIFSERPLPNYDRFELAAFQRWLSTRYSLSELQLRWRQTPAQFASWEQVSLPQAEDYSTDTRNPATRQMLKVMDYTHFSQEAFRAWAALMVETIRGAGCRTIIGAGQDEAGARLSPQYYASAVDYTTTHPWWNNGDLLCDMLLDKTIERPNIIQETGVMLARDIDMQPWRSEQEGAYLLERKLITGLIARGAGLIQWLWHINAYMTSENENSIGLVRPDGSAKPEMGVMHEIGRLMKKLSGQLYEIETPPNLWVVVPYDQWFLRPALAIEPMRQAMRVLGYDLGLIPQVVGQHQLVELVERYQPETIILPALQYFEDASWQALMTFVERGSTLLVSGVIGRDQHNLVRPGLEELPFEQAQNAELVQRYEYLSGLSEEPQLLNYEADKTLLLKKAHNKLISATYGNGQIFWSGLPLEQAHASDVTRQVYQLVTQTASRQAKQESPLLVIKRALKNGELLLIVSESSSEQQLEIGPGQTIAVEARRAGAVLLRPEQEAHYFGGVRKAM